MMAAYRKKRCQSKKGKACKMVWLREKGEKGRGGLSVSSGNLTVTLSNVRAICQKRENREEGDPIYSQWKPSISKKP
ncbi:unnamed protein product [Prunus armeniaca]